MGELHPGDSMATSETHRKHQDHDPAHHIRQTNEDAADSEEGATSTLDLDVTNGDRSQYDRNEAGHHGNDVKRKKLENGWPQQHDSN